MSEAYDILFVWEGLGMLDAGTLLDFAARHPRVRGEVEERIRRELGVTPARYCQLLHRAAATLEGQAHDPITAHRVLRELQQVA